MKPAEILWGFDFYSFWAAARVWNEGGNPYDVEALWFAQQSAGWPPDMEGHFFPYPPWALLLFGPMALIPFTLANCLWSLVSLGIIVHSGFLLDRFISQRFKLERAGLVSILTVILLFPPTLRSLILGQTAFLNLYACALGLSMMTTRQFAAGMVFSITIIKFQIFLPVYAGLAGAAIRARGTSFLMGLISGIICVIGLTHILDGQIINRYYQFLKDNYSMLQTVPVQTFMATLAENYKPENLRIITTIAASLSFFGFALALRFGPDLVIIFGVPLALVLSPYSWLHDSLAALAGFMMAYRFLPTKWLCWLVALVSGYLTLLNKPEVMTSILPLVILGALLWIALHLKNIKNQYSGQS